MFTETLENYYRFWHQEFFQIEVLSNREVKCVMDTGWKNFEVLHSKNLDGLEEIFGRYMSVKTVLEWLRRK